MSHFPAGRRPCAGFFSSAAAVLLAACAANAAALEATSGDGRYRIRETGGALQVLAGSDGRELRRIPLLDRSRRAGRLAWAIDLPKRRSLLVGFADLPEAWELPYGENAEPVYDGLVHDYRLGEGIADRGPLPVRRIPLEAPMPRPRADERSSQVSWPDPRDTAKRIVLNLDVRRIVAVREEPVRRDTPVDAKIERAKEESARRDGPAVARIERVQVVAAASRVEESIDSVAATMSVIERREIFREVAGNLRDLLRYEPGVSIENGATRFGLGNLSIRGLDGNRVQMTVDGIRLPESYRVGSFSSASRNAIGVGLLRQVEIVRGPASAIHGSDALAGVVAFTTLDPGAYLAPGKTNGGEVFGGYAQADRGISRGAVAAAAAGSTQLLAGAERTDGREIANRGDTDATGSLRTRPNPQDSRSESQLLKWVVPTDAGVRYTITADRFAREARTDVLTLNPQSPRTTSLAGDDRARRNRLSAEAVAYDIAGLSRLALTFYAQAALTQQDTEELRTNTTAACLSAAGAVRCLREPRFRYEASEKGLVALGQSEPAWGGLDHRLVLGLEASRTRTEELRNGRQTNLVTGTVTSIVGGEPLPTRDFPVTDADRLGAFVQDSFSALDPRLTWIPGLRFDAFRLRPRPDDVFTSGNPGRPVASLSDQAFSPKLGLLWRFAPSLTAAAQVATGFRAPPAADLNIGLTSLPAGYTVVPNPALKPETSRGLEAGLRWRSHEIDGQATFYYTRYRDLIVSRAALACPADPACVPGATGTFQSQNVSSARILGLEAQGAWRFAKGWTLRASVSMPRGDDLGKDVPLNSVDPARAVAGLAYEAGDWGSALHLTHSREQTRVDRSTGIRFVPPGWTIADITAWWRPAPGLEIAAGVFNITDRKYWAWADVRGLTTITTGFDRYTQPGRNAAVNARWSF